MMLSIKEKKELINKEIEGLEQSIKGLQHEIEIAEFMDEEDKVRWNKDTLEYCFRKLDKYKDKLSKIEEEGTH